MKINKYKKKEKLENLKKFQKLLRKTLYRKF